MATTLIMGFQDTDGKPAVIELDHTFEEVLDKVVSEAPVIEGESAPSRFKRINTYKLTDGSRIMFHPDAVAAVVEGPLSK